MKKRNIFWGLAFIAVAAIFLLDAINISIEIPFIRIALGIICLAWGISSVLKLHLGQFTFSIAFLIMLFEKELAHLMGRSDENIISNVMLLIASGLLAIGFKLLFPKNKVNTSGKKILSKRKSKNVFSSAVKYLDCSDLYDEGVSNSFGSFDVYFQNLDCYPGGATLVVDNSFGELNLYLPSTWNVKVKVSNSFGHINTYGNNNPEGKEFNIVGNNSFGETNIHLG